MPELLYSDLTFVIRGAIFEVWNCFRGAFKESVIENALVIALKKRNIEVERQKRIPVYFDQTQVGIYIPDLIVCNQIIVELKSKPFLTLEDRRQFWYYLKGSNYKLGFLINFGNKLEIVRRIYDTARDAHMRPSA